MKIIFFDGICGLCNGFVDFILKIDKKKEFRFCPLQSDYAKNNLPSEYTKDLKSVVYLSNGKIYSRSDAVMKILSEIGGPWKIAGAAQILPSFIRDTAYNLIAENRYKIFGKKETCRLPTPEERSRFVT